MKSSNRASSARPARPRTQNLHRYVLRYQIGFHDVFQRLMDHSMVADDGIK